MELKDVVFLFWEATAVPRSETGQQTTFYSLTLRFMWLNPAGGLELWFQYKEGRPGNSMRPYITKTPHGLDIILNKIPLFLNLVDVWNIWRHRSDTVPIRSKVWFWYQEVQHTSNHRTRSELSMLPRAMWSWSQVESVKTVRRLQGGFCLWTCKFKTQLTKNNTINNKSSENENVHVLLYLKFFLFCCSTLSCSSDSRQHFHCKSTPGVSEPTTPPTEAITTSNDEWCPIVPANQASVSSRSCSFASLVSGVISDADVIAGTSLSLHHLRSPARLLSHGSVLAVVKKDTDSLLGDDIKGFFRH